MVPVVTATLGPFPTNQVTLGDSRDLIAELPDGSVDVLCCSPPYWGQRQVDGIGIEEDPRDYLNGLLDLFAQALPKLADDGIMWVNVGDAYNTAVNWRASDHVHSTLGADKSGLAPENSAYTKARHKRSAFIDDDEPWLQYGNLLALPYRMVTGLSDNGWLYRGEVMWRKKNAMPEGRCRRPHRQHEPIYLFSKTEQHRFKVSPPVPSVWEFANERLPGKAHHSRYPIALPAKCIDALGDLDSNTVVLDPFAGSGSTGIAAIRLGCQFVGFEIDPGEVTAANERLNALSNNLDSISLPPDVGTQPAEVVPINGTLFENVG